VTVIVARYESRGDILATLEEDNRWTVPAYPEARAGQRTRILAAERSSGPLEYENVVVVPGDDRIAVFDHGVETVRGIYHRDRKRFSIAPPPPQLNPH